MKTWHGHYPEPLREAPAMGTLYWAVNLLESPPVEAAMPWGGDLADFLWLQRGRLHDNREAAEAQARFEIELAGGSI